MSQESLAPHGPESPASTGKDATPYILGGFAVFICLWFRTYFTSHAVASVDLPGHLTAIRGYLTNWHWWSLSPVFYDVSGFTGYPAFQFYPFLAHLGAAIVSIPLSLFADDPVRLAAHLMLVASLALLPWSMMRVADPLVREIWESPGQHLRYRWVLAVVSCTFAFWFINHDHQWYGVGAASVLNIGLFSQAFGWHLMMLHLGALIVFVRDGGKGDCDKLALWFALLLLTHTLTAVFSAFVGLLSILWFNNRRRDLVKAHLLSFLLAGFWVVPMVVYLSPFTRLDIWRPTGDFLGVFLRYPLYPMFRSIGSWLHGHFTPLSPVEMVVMALLALFMVSQESKRSRLHTTFMVFGVVGLVLLTSGFIASSVPFGFHWYRFLAYLFVYFTLMLSPLPFLVLKAAQERGEHSPWVRSAKIAVTGVFVGCFIATTRLPHFERQRILRSASPDFLANEDAVLNYFRELPFKGRVITEYFNDYDKFPFLSCHVISTRMLRETGFEPINGLFIQGSLAYHLPMGSANQLQANSYHCPLLYPTLTNLTDDGKLNQLKEYGITHIVGIAGSDFSGRIKARAIGDPLIIGPYQIMQILAEPPAMARTVEKRVAVYLDARGTLPYKFVELFFYAKRQLTAGWELLELKKGDPLPPQTEMVIINGSQDQVREHSGWLLNGMEPSPAVIPLDYEQHYLTRHYKVQYQHNMELDDFTDAGSYLEKKASLVDQAARVPSIAVAKQLSTADMRWDEDRQAFELGGLEPGRLYRINYSYFPFWRSGEGRVMRGSGERIFFVPNRANARFSFAPYRSGSLLLGWLLSLSGAWLIWRNRKKAPAGGASCY